MRIESLEEIIFSSHINSRHFWLILSLLQLIYLLVLENDAAEIR